MANILITGGAGFIGSHTADALIEQGHRVRILDLLDSQIHGENPSSPAYLNSAVEVFRGDVRRLDDVAEALEGVEVIYHFAALTGVGQSMYELRDYVDTNCTGTAALLEVLLKRQRPIKRIVLASSRAVYGEGTHHCPVHGKIYPAPRRREDLECGRFEFYCQQCGGPLETVATKEDRPLNPVSVYAWTKKHQEEQCQHVAGNFQVPITILRYFNVYGSRQSLRNPYTGIVSIFYSRIMARRPVFVYEHGLPGRDFVHVSDVARANFLALEADVEPGTCINIGSGVESNILDVVAALSNACGRTPEIQDRGEFRFGDIHSCYAHLDRALHLLRYEPKVALRDGMREFTDWAAGEVSVDRYQEAVDELGKHGLMGKVRDQT